MQPRQGRPRNMEACRTARRRCTSRRCPATMAADRFEPLCLLGRSGPDGAPLPIYDPSTGRGAARRRNGGGMDDVRNDVGWLVVCRIALGDFRRGMGMLVAHRNHVAGLDARDRRVIGELASRGCSSCLISISRSI